MVGLGLKMGMETKQIFSVHPNPKPRTKRIDYEIHNYCATCGIKYPKDILRCSDCKHRIRITGWHSRKEVDVKRIKYRILKWNKSESEPKPYFLYFIKSS